ncbi:MAG: thiamine-phosphate kinase [Bacteroidales bacterium]|nr:thiamine-phosphate kinase [Bacteroidales bacterium]
MEDDKNTEKNISNLGEFGLIEHLTKNIQLYNKSTKLGVGDDAAVLKYGSNEILISSDLLTEGIHFDLIYSPLKHLGYKAAVVNFSDIYAMNGIPRQITLALAVSQKIKLSMLEEFYSGINLACEKYGVDFVGGDTSTSLTGMHIAITVVGEAKKGKITFRKGAKTNDLICVSGELGGAYMGLQLLEREKKLFLSGNVEQPILEGHSYILEKQLKPEARKDIVQLFETIDLVPTAMIDISDGLSSDIFHICKQSDSGCKIYAEKIPIHHETKKMADEFNIDPLIAAFNGGEDYELLFTVSPNDFDKISNRPEITIIGYITDKQEGKYMVTKENQLIELQAQGWDTTKA